VAPTISAYRPRPVSTVTLQLPATRRKSRAVASHAPQPFPLPGRPQARRTASAFP
jgi:hypothetical protein